MMVNLSVMLWPLTLRLSDRKSFLPKSFRLSYMLGQTLFHQPWLDCLSMKGQLYMSQLEYPPVVGSEFSFHQLVMAHIGSLL